MWKCFPDKWAGWYSFRKRNAPYLVKSMIERSRLPEGTELVEGKMRVVLDIISEIGKKCVPRRP